MSRATVFLLGCGLQFPGDLTQRTLEALKNSELVFCLPGLDLKAHTDADVVDLSKHYSESIHREDSYLAMAEEVLRGAALGRSVSFITYGHPVVGTTATQAIYRLADRNTTDVITIDAPSSIESICAVLQLDPFAGLQVIEANKYLHWPAAATSTRSWLFLMQVPYIGAETATHTLSSERYRPEALLELQARLLASYPADHPALFVRAAVLDYKENIIATEVGKVSRDTPLSAATLVIPPKS